MTLSFKESIVLRQHQLEAKPAIYSHFRKDKKSVPLVVIPTGGGKSMIIADLAIDAINNNRSMLVITHSKELVGQNAKELQDNVDKRIKVGICSSGHKKFDVTSDIIFAGIQTIVNRLDECRSFNLVVIDECHRISLDDMTQYQELIDKLLVKNPNTRFCGLTATPFRMGQGFITDPYRDSKTKQPRNSFFTKIAYEAKITDLLDRGELCAIRTVESNTSIKTEAGDNNWSFVFDAAAYEFIEQSKIHKRRRTLIFVSTTEQCRYFKELLQDVPCTAKILSSTIKEDLNREGILKWFAEDDDDHRAIINMDILTTGFNQKDIDCILTLIRTDSINKYVQIVGRGLRVHPKKDYCLFLDYGRHAERLGTIDNLKVRQSGDGEMILKFCPVETGGCGEQNFPSVKVCWNCGKEFVSKLDLEKFDLKASKKSLIEAYEPPLVMAVDSYVFNHNEGRNGKADTIRITYWMESSPVVNEWLSVKSDKASFRKHSIMLLRRFFKSESDFWDLYNDIEYNFFEWGVSDMVDFLNDNRDLMIDVHNVKAKKDGSFMKFINFNVEWNNG